jgi:predicted ATPase
MRATAGAVPHNLPRPATAFVGREPELALIAQHLADPNCRLVTLTGPGGTGKTRLALEAAARQLDAFPDGAFLVRLESMSDAAFIAPTVADVLGLPLQGQHDPAVQVSTYLRTKTLLLIMDNFEHVLSGAGVLAAILADGAGVKCLVTSREPLGLEEEWVLALGGLPVPSAAGAAVLEASSAGQLFIQRARQVRATFALTEGDAPAVQRICRMVGGLPLGIELAAAWVKMLSCAEIAQEIERNLDFLNTTLRNVPERHRSVRAVFEYSWHLLTAEERRVFRQLAVFRGGFRRDAAAAVIGAGLPVLAALADKSLLQMLPGGRYERHTLLWQYALEKLAAEPGEETAAYERHGVYFARFLEQRAEALRGTRPQEALTEIDAEIENIRAAWRWMLAEQRLAEIARSVESLESFYDTRGWYQEGEEVFGQAVAALDRPDAPTTDEAQRLLGLVLARQGGFRARQGRLAEAAGLLERSLAVLSPLQARRELAYVRLRLGAVVAQQGEYAQAMRDHQDSLALARSSGDPWGVMHALNALGLDTAKLGDYAGARARYEESLHLARDLGDQRMVARILNYLGYMLCRADQPAEAEPLLQESLLLAEDLGDQGLIPYVLGSLGQAAYTRGDYTEAETRSLTSLERAEELGDRMLMTYNLQRLGETAAAQGTHRVARYYFRQGLRTAMEIAALPRALAALVGLAEVQAQAQTGDPLAAAALVAHPLRHPATEQTDRQRAERLLAALIAEWGDAAVAAAQQRGQAQPLLAVVEDVLGTRLPQSLASLLQPPEFEVTLDEQQQARQVEEITETDFFAELRARAAALRSEFNDDFDSPGQDQPAES